MSKTLGNVLDPFQVIDVYGVDALRYYCFREVSFGQDGSISTEGFEARYNTELANDYGNLASRTIAMIDRYRDGTVPEAAPPAELAEDFAGLRETVAAHLDRVELRLALEEIWKRVRRLNQFVEQRAPWNLAKDDGSAALLDETLYGLAEGLRVVSVLLHAYIPDAAGRGAGGAGRREQPTRRRSTTRSSARGRAARRSSGSRRSSRRSRRSRQLRRRAAQLNARQVGMLIGVSAIWGASYLLIKIALDGFEPAVIVFLRVLLAAALLYVVILARGGADRAALATCAAARATRFIQGTLAVALPFSLIAFGETQITSGLTGVLISPGPLFVALLAPAIDRTRARRPARDDRPGDRLRRSDAADRRRHGRQRR